MWGTESNCDSNDEYDSVTESEERKRNCKETARTAAGHTKAAAKDAEKQHAIDSTRQYRTGKRKRALAKSWTRNDKRADQFQLENKEATDAL